MENIAVITDATSSGYWFPRWYDYYSNQFGAQSIFVITYRGRASEFRDYKLGGILELPCEYNDQSRVQFISSFAQTLLGEFDVLVRVDVDEFLVADPEKHSSLRDFICRNSQEYVTPIGVEIIERRGETPLVFGKPLIKDQRSHALVSSALNKTSITRIPLKWGYGFHSTTLSPNIDCDLYLFHTKFCDMAQRMAWVDEMISKSEGGSPDRRYFEGQLRTHTQNQSWIYGLTVDADWSKIIQEARIEEFTDSANAHAAPNKVGTFFHGKTAFIIPEKFRAVF